MEIDFLKEIFKPRNPRSNKSNFGHATIIGGCSKYVGAPKFSYESSLKTLSSFAESTMIVGCGTSTIALPDFLANSIYPFVSYSSIYKLSSNGDYIVFNKNEIDELMLKTKAFAIGMGSGDSETKDIVEYIINNGSQQVVVDADALIKCRDLDFKNKAVLTPHIGEFAKLTGINDRVRILENAKLYARTHNCVLVVKDYETIVTDGNIIFKNNNGNQKLAKGGSGDCLAGIICGLLAFGVNLLDASRAGCYILGRCSEISTVNEFSHLPKDIIECIPKVIDEITNMR